MRLCVLADVHGNLVALETVLADAQAHGVDGYACLGDIVGYGPNPGECLDLLRSLDCRIVQGNHEAALLGKPTAGRFNDYARIALELTRGLLNEEQLKYIETLEPSLEIGGEIQLSHGSPQDRDEYLIFLHQIEEMLAKANYWITFCGHSHLQFLHDGKKLHGGELQGYELQDELRYLINPGSVGQPRDRDWRTGYCLVDTTARVVDQIRLEYDLEATIRAYKAAGLPEYSWERLKQGR